MWIEPVSTAITAAELVSEVTKSSTLIRKHAKRLLYRVRNGKAVIPIFGAGGVGKTTVSKLVVGEDPLSITAPYEESATVETRKLKGDVPGQILAAPGQLTRVRFHWPTLFQKLTIGESFGLINVVANGYHSIRLASYKDHEVYQSGMTAADFAKAYSEARRAIELELLDTLIGGLSAVTKPIWIVMLVNKQDLWWRDQKAVRKHYENGEYSARVAKLESALGSRSFNHELLPVSFAMTNLGSDDGDLFAKTNAGYDLPTHLRYLQSMFTCLQALLEGGRRR